MKMDWISHKGVAFMAVKVMKKSITTNPNNFDYEQYYKLVLKQVAKKVMELKPHDRNGRTTKDNVKSSEMRRKGNKEYASSDNSTEGLTRALELYTQSVGFATLDSEELVLAYSNRAVVLFRVNRFAECLLDLERALDSEFRIDDKFTLKLQFRKAECLQRLATQSYSEAQFWLTEIPQNDNTRRTWMQELKNYPVKSNESFMVDQETVVPKITHPNEKFPCASDAIDVNYSETFGRHVVATRDIDAGELLMVEKPYQNYLNEGMSYTYCNYCLRVMWAGIPCEQCPHSFYCSEDCKKSAWEKYHQFECLYLDLMYEYSFHEYDRLAGRLLFQALTEAGSLKELRLRIESLCISSGCAMVSTYLFHEINKLNFYLVEFFSLQTNQCGL